MRKTLKLRETITTPKLKGIFLKLGSREIEDSDVFEFISDNKVTLNVDYYDIYSRNKMASHYFNKDTNLDYVYIDNDDVVFIDDNDYIGISQSYDDIYDELTNIIIMRFKDKWERVFKALVLEDYNALENYNMHEIRTPDLTDLRTLNLLKTLTKNSADNRTLNYSDNRTINTKNKRTADLHTDDKNAVNQDLDTTELTNRFGYNDNGADGSPYEKKTSNVNGTGVNNYTDRDIDESGTDTMDNTGTDNVAHTGTDNVAHTGYDTDADTGTDTLTHTGTETLERSGNIGVTTSQQMLESEIKLRALYNMIYIIYDDVDRVLTNPIFID